MRVESEEEGGGGEGRNTTNDITSQLVSIVILL